MALNIYKSSAGSGKTYTLAKEYLKLLIKRPDRHANILAVTFTNKATQEMKHRILSFLIELSNGQNDGLAQQLINELALEGHSYSPFFIKTHSQKALTEILHNYSQFTILTIDSFFNRIIKAFAHEMKLPLKMDLQLNQNKALEEAYDRLMLNLAKEIEVQDWLSQFMFNKLENDKGWYIEREVKKLGNELFKEDYQIYEKELRSISLSQMQNLVLKLHKIQTEIEQKIRQFGNDAQDLIHKNGLQISDFAYGKSGVANHFVKMAEWNLALFDPAKRVLDASEDDEKWLTKKHPSRNQIMPLVSSQLNPLLNVALNYIEDNHKAYRSAVGISKNIYALGLLNHLQEMLKNYRDETDIILISDQNKLINQIISDSDIPFIYEKTGTRFQHYLIDEFQDTSAVQWNNFKPLLQNALAQDNKVLLVGDAKQSIYRWRGGDMQLLLNQVEQDLSNYTTDNTVKNLQENYRSSKVIIDFNNLFFSKVQSVLPVAQDIVGEAFQDVKQLETARTPKGGFVNYRCFTNDDMDEDNDMSIKDVVCQYIITSIQKLLSEFDYRNIAILVETNREGALIAESLNDHGIPIQSTDSLLLVNAASIQFISCCLRLKQNPNDVLLKVEFALNMQYFNLLTPDNDYWMEKAKGADFFELLPTSWNQFFTQNQQGTLLSIAHQIINDANLNNTEPAYIQRFCELVLEYESQNDANLTEFLNWWDETASKQSIQVSEDNNAVVISTIHRSKGLQYPIVFVPFLSRALAPKADQILWANSTNEPYDEFAALPINYSSAQNSYFEEAQLKELSFATVDALNMLYVAFTRAEQQLYILPAIRKAGPQSTGKLVKMVLDSNKEIAEQTSTDSFSIGNPQKLELTKDQPIEIENLQEYFLPLQQNNLQLKSSRYQLNDLHNGKQKKAINKGLLMHELLAKINSVEQIDTVIQNAVIEGLISVELQKEWKTALIEVLNVPAYIELLQNADKIISEQDIISNSETLRPDKVFIINNIAHVVDFKTGAEREEHIDQINDYIFALKQMHYQQVIGYLFYTETLNLIKI